MQKLKFLTIPCERDFYIRARTQAAQLDLAVAELGRRAIADYLEKLSTESQQGVKRDKPERIAA